MSEQGINVNRVGLVLIILIVLSILYKARQEVEQAQQQLRAATTKSAAGEACAKPEDCAYTLTCVNLKCVTIEQLRRQREQREREQHRFPDVFSPSR